MKTTRSTPQFSLSLPNLTFRSMPEPAGYRITLIKTETKGAYELSLESLRSMKQWTCAIANTQSVSGDETQLPSAMLFDLLRTVLERRNEQLKLLETLGGRLSELFGDLVMRGTATDVDLVPGDSGAVVLTLTIPLLPGWSTSVRYRCEEKPFDSLNAVCRKVEHLEKDVEILATKVDMHISIIVLAILLVVGAVVSLSVTKF